MLIDYKEELNEQQYKAATLTDGPVLVIAGAGSGKTRTLIYRVANLVENDVAPGSILLLTFTRKSAQEMMARASRLLDKRCMCVAGGTFHSFANMTLRRYADKVGYTSKFTVMDRSDSEEIISMIRSEMGMNTKDADFPKKSTLLNIVSKSANTQRSHLEILNEEYPDYFYHADKIGNLINKYYEYKVKNDLMDYDDLLLRLRMLLIENKEIRQYLSSIYKYIMIDEYQDTNRIQAEIACYLASEHGNIMVVGDDSQSIYSFRGADFKNIMDFPKIFKETQVIKLEQNYRSSQAILDFTNTIIKYAKEKYAKKLFTKSEFGLKPFYMSPFDVYDQAKDIVGLIKKAHFENNVPLSKIAILFRSGWQSNELEMELKHQDLPFDKFGGIKFTEAAHIKDLTSYLRVIYNKKDLISWMRILRMLDGIGEKTAQRITETAIEGIGVEALLHKSFSGKKYSEDLEKLHVLLSEIKQSPSPAFQLEKAAEYYDQFFNKRYDDTWKRENDIKSLKEMSLKYKNLEELLTDITLDPPSAFQDEEDKLTLSTIHSAKGLEWDTVFLISANDGYLPSSRSMNSVESLEEERRLMYVACTRAEQKLYISALQTAKAHGAYGEMETINPSVFINEMIEFEDITQPFKEIKIVTKKKNRYQLPEAQRDYAKKNKTYLDDIAKYFANF